MLVLVTGATGFLGRYVVRELLAHEHRVRCLVHTPGRERIFPDRSVDVHYGNVLDGDALSSACAGVDAIVHLVAIIRQTRSLSYDQVNRQGTANVMAAAKEAGSVHKIVHLSAIGSANNPSFPYLYSKWQGERAVMDSGLPYTIIRSSIIFGEGDEFLNPLAGMVRVFPIVPVVGSGRNRFQPIAAEDVARCVALSLTLDDLKGKTIEIGGPEQLSYNQLVGIVARTMGKRRLRFHIPVWLMRMVLPFVQILQSRPPLTTEMLRMVSIRSVAEIDVVERTFGFTPRPIEGNIDYVRSITFADGMRISLGLMPSRIRDH